MDRSCTRRTEITIETHSVTIVSSRRESSDMVFCGECGRYIHAFRDEQTAAYTDKCINETSNEQNTEVARRKKDEI